MAYKIFISHSTNDHGLVKLIFNMMTLWDFEPRIAVRVENVGVLSNETDKSKIQDSNCLFVVLTKDGINAIDVDTEIGIAIEMNKIIITFVEKGVTLPDPLLGPPDITFDRTDMDSSSPSMKTLKRRLDDLVERESR